eukprot:c14911_g1_i1 orf=114-1022(-)
MNVRSFMTKVKPKARRSVAKLHAHLQAYKGFTRILRRLGRIIWQQIMVSLTGCGNCGAVVPYQRLKRSRSLLSDNSEAELKDGCVSPPPVFQASNLLRSQSSNEVAIDTDEAEDTVALKFSILGDCETGKTSFVTKYVSAGESDEYAQTMGVISMEKVFRIQNARIALCLWDLGGHWQCLSMLPMVCKDAAAILFVFDLTRRSTLLSVKEWFVQARQWNKTAIPVIIGTKYDHFVQLPQDIQLAIIRQARFYAEAMEASLFFSSVTHNINIHKIFKVIVAKLFDLPCNISRNLKFGEPIIDY